MKLRPVAVAVVAAIALSGCAAALMGRAASTPSSGGGTTSSAPAQTSGGSAQRPSSASGSSARTSAQVEQDRQIAAAVRNKLIADASTKSLSVGVDAYQGIVSLRGNVEKAEQRSAAERVALSVAGVRSVRNELRVR